LSNQLPNQLHGAGHTIPLTIDDDYDGDDGDGCDEGFKNTVGCCHRAVGFTSWQSELDSTTFKSNGVNVSSKFPTVLSCIDHKVAR
jgi:hypothetical protein